LADLCSFKQFPRKNEEWKLKAEKIKHMQELEQQQKTTPHPTAVSKPVLATLPVKPSKAPLPLALGGLRLMESAQLPMFKPSGPMKGFLKQQAKVAHPLNTQVSSIVFKLHNILVSFMLNFHFFLTGA
jgi:hypothetical protein